MDHAELWTSNPLGLFASGGTQRSLITGLEAMAERIEARARWADLVVHPETERTLREIVAQVRSRPIVYGAWGVDDSRRRGGVSALFSGGPGTGKSLAAEVLANELGADLLRIDLSVLVSQYIGETEKNVRRAFDAAESSGAVLILDEADALFGKRSEVTDAHDRHANVEVSYLLQRVEAYSGLAILTTNLRDAVDQAFMRRLRFRVHFRFPVADTREKIWRRAFADGVPTEGLDFEKLSRLGVSGGTIRNIAVDAAFLAAEEHEPVTMERILRATRREVEKLGRALSAQETEGWM